MLNFNDPNSREPWFEISDYFLLHFNLATLLQRGHWYKSLRLFIYFNLMILLLRGHPIGHLYQVKAMDNTSHWITKRSWRHLRRTSLIPIWEHTITYPFQILKMLQHGRAWQASMHRLRMGMLANQRMIESYTKVKYVVWKKR